VAKTFLDYAKHSIPFGFCMQNLPNLFKMKSKLIRIFLLIGSLSLAFTETVRSQFQDMKFDYLNVDNGLSNNRINCLLRDSKGYLWIGTEMGLNKYDGYKITTYLNQISQKNTLSDNRVNCLFEDQLNNLWIGTGNGLNKFDRKTETFKFYKSGSLNEISDNNICSIIEDKKGNVWIATGYGLNRWNPRIDNFSQFYIPAKENQHQANYITSVIMDANGCLWLGTNDNRLWYFNTETFQFKSISDPVFSSTLGLTKRMIEGKDSVIWIGTYGNGLYSFDLATKKIQQYSAQGDGKGTYGKLVQNLFFDGKHYLYIAVDHGGINRLDLFTKSFEYCLMDEKKENGLNNNGLVTVYFDKEGIFYAGTLVGLNINNPLKGRFKTYRHNVNNNNSLTFNLIHRFYEDSQGLIWIGTDGGGVSVFDPKLKTFKNYQHKSDDPYSLSENSILSITEDKNHDIWLGTWGAGLNRFDRKSGKFYHYIPNPDDPRAISSTYIWNLFTDNTGNIWICCHYMGMDIFNIQLGVIKKYCPDANWISPQTNRIIHQRNGETGFATEDGYFVLDSITKDIKQTKIFKGISLNDVYLDKNGNYWGGTSENGILVVKPDGTTEQFDNSNGFPSNSISSITDDKNGNIWILTASGLSEYIVRSKKFDHFTVSDGLQGMQFSRFAFLKSKDGTIYIGGYNGFNTFQPDDVKVNPYIPNVYINEFQIFNKQVPINTKGSPLKQSIAETKELVLSYKQSVFSFGFTAINFTYPEKAIYAYKMDGYDKEWNYTDASRRYASYTNLDPGEYTFMVKASNNDGLWNEKPVTIKITIVPPFWSTLWFRAILIIFIIGSAFIYYKRRTNTLIKQKRVLELKVRERTEELENTNTLLEERQEEILQQNEEIKLQKEIVEDQNNKIEKAYQELTIYEHHLEEIVEERTKQLEISKQKAVESDELKSSFLKNMSHEVRTPLNAIVGFSNLMTKSNQTLDKLEKFAGLISASSNKLIEIITDVVEISQIHANQVKAILAEIEFISFINKLIESYKVKAKEKNIKLLLNINIPFKEYFIFSDDEKIKKILLHLLDNAIKFTIQGSVVINCELKNDDINISISDTGIGVSEEMQKKIFEPFRQVETGACRDYGGNGLGLSIAKSYIELLNGSISLKSEINKGTTVYISISANKSNMQITQKDINKQSYSIHTILIAEDEYSNYQYLLELLSDTDLNVIHAANGQQALEMCRANQEVDLILMDIKMPIMDGHTAAKLIKAFLPNLPIIAQTAYALESEKEMFIGVFDDWISKPISEDELKQKLIKYIDNQ
jgi:signal transduction histidine kinase/ligand-binding sensor domain-containing protein/CheY-like chemotaxis protein